jgi:hypothetical protein
MAGRDPIGANPRERQLGAAALARGGHTPWELADVIAFNSATHTAVLRTHTGRPLRDVPQIKCGPRVFEHLPTGTTVVVSYDLGFPAIIGVIDFVGLPQAAIAAPSLTGVDGIGDDNPLQPTRGSNNYRSPFAPTDMTQGDWARVGTLGHGLAVLEGGITQIGAPSALVRSLAASGLLQTVAQRMVTVTDFGQWTVENDQGRTSLILRAGANQSTQTGLDEEHWTIRLDLGATGDLLDFRITDPVGKTLFRLHVGADGRTQIYGDGGVDISSGPSGDAETRHDIAGPRTSSVGGDDTVLAEGNRIRRIGRSATENIGTDKTTVVGNDEARFINRDQTVNVGGKRTDIVVGGAAQDAKPGAVALHTKIVNGGWQIQIGNPEDGANISAQAAYRLTTSLGEVAVESGGKMSLKARQVLSADSDSLVTLNGQTYALLKTDDFLRDLATFLSTLLAVLQAGTQGSPVAQQLVGLSAAQASLQKFITSVSSAAPYLSTKVRNG